MTFDPDFNDCAWTNAWAQFAIIQPVPGIYGDFRVRSWEMDEAEVCGEAIRLEPPLMVRGLVDADGQLWMSDVPQERLMMYNNAQASRGHVLVGGLGLGLFPQYAMPFIERLTIVEESPHVIEIVQPLVEMAATASGRDFDIRQGDVAEFLAANPIEHYDTIFLDTWPTLDAVHMPLVNTLRHHAEKHIKSDGRILLWGYQWMVNLFLDACKHLLEIAPVRRKAWLKDAARTRADIEKLLIPVVDQFKDMPIADTDAALGWCREHIQTVMLDG